MEQRFVILRDFVTRADLSNDDVFAHVVRCAVDDLGLAAADVGNTLSVSRPTVERWMRGTIAPHVAMREPIRRFMLRKLGERL